MPDNDNQNYHVKHLIARPLPKKYKCISNYRCFPHREWIKAEVLGNRTLSNRLPYKLRRLVKLWAFDNIQSQKGEDTFFAKDNVFWNRRNIRTSNDKLSCYTLEDWWDRDIKKMYQHNRNPEICVNYFLRFHKMITMGLRWLSHYKNTYPCLGITRTLIGVNKYYKKTS